MFPARCEAGPAGLTIGGALG